jgi:hypothetical protein
MTEINESVDTMDLPEAGTRRLPWHRLGPKMGRQSGFRNNTLVCALNNLVHNPKQSAFWRTETKVYLALEASQVPNNGPDIPHAAVFDLSRCRSAI